MSDALSQLRLCYPDGEPCRVGDLVWLDGGLRLGRVTALAEELQVMNGLTGDIWGTGRHPAASTQRLTKTEELAVELLFHLLGRQLGLKLRNKADWLTTAQKRPAGGGEYVWELTFAPQDSPEARRSFRFDRCHSRFLSDGEPLPPPPAPAPSAREARSITSRDGVSYREGDLLWEYRGQGVQVSRLSSIITPEDEDWDWFYELQEEENRVPHADTMGIDERSGGCICPASFADDEWGGRLSDTEVLATELLALLVKEHPGYRQYGWDSCLGHIELAAREGVPHDPSSYWEYQYDEWRVQISFCSRRKGDSHIHGHRYFLFDRTSCTFLQQEDSTFMTGGGVRGPWWHELKTAFLNILNRRFPPR